MNNSDQLPWRDVTFVTLNENTLIPPNLIYYVGVYLLNYLESTCKFGPME